MPLMNKLRTWMDLTPHERSLFIQASALLPIVAMLLHLGGLQRTQSMLARLAPQPSLPPKDAFHQAKRTAFVTGIAARYGKPWSNCLKRSLVLWYLLRRQGIASDLRIGVRREQGEFQAHAWIEYESIIVNDSPSIHQCFTAFEQPLNI